MKIATSYFYQIRHFKRNMIPISTAIWDPKWFYRDIPGEPRSFKDKHGIYNGLRINELNPAGISGECHGPKECTHKPESCEFLKSYKKKLNDLDFDKLYARLENIANKIKITEGFDEEPIIVLIVYEKPDVECSERKTLQKYFIKHGIDCKELEYPIN